MKHASRIAVSSSGMLVLQTKCRLEIWPLGYLIFFWETKEYFYDETSALKAKRDIDIKFNKYPAN